MNRFEYLEARTLPEAIALLGQDEGTRIVAGATDFLVRWRQGVWKPRSVLSIQRIPGLDRVDYLPATGLSLGSLVTIRTLELHPLIQQHYPALSQAATTFAGVQIRNLATVGGNICNASPSGDTLPALIAYGAECRLLGPEGERLVPLESFFMGPGRTALRSCRAPRRAAPAAATTTHRSALYQTQPPQRHGHLYGGRGVDGHVRSPEWRLSGGPDQPWAPSPPRSYGPGQPRRSCVASALKPG